MGIRDERKKFQKDFDEDSKEILVLTGSSSCAGRTGKEKLWTASQGFLAYVDLETGEVEEGKGRLEWLASEEDSKKGGWIHNLKKDTIYQLKVREKKAKTSPENEGLWLNNTFMLVEVVKRNVSQPVLNRILEDYKKPVVIEDPLCGQLTLDKEFGWFEGDLDWLGQSCAVSLDTDADQEITAASALNTLYLLLKQPCEWDEKIRSFAAKQLTGLANDWLQDSDEEDPEAITEAAFAERISICDMVIHLDGDFEIYYNDDDMFWGHVIIVSGNINGEFEDADIAG